MKTDFGIRIKDEILRKADQYAESQGIDLEALLIEYLRFLAIKAEKHEKQREDLRDYLDSLHREFDTFMDTDAKKDYRRYLIEKYK